MPRSKNFNCQVCGKESYKKDLRSVSVSVSGQSKSGDYRWTRNIRTKIGVCSGPCSRIWRKENIKKINDEQGA